MSMKDIVGYLKTQQERVERLRQLDRTELRTRIGRRLAGLLSPRLNALRVTHAAHAAALRPFDGPYSERPPVGPSNLAVKLARVAQGGPFEPYDVVLINRATASIAALLPGVKRIVEVGCGTGRFVAELAARRPDLAIVASELDSGALAWARQHRAVPGVEYCERELHQLIGEGFDLAVSIDVIEHVEDYGGFLQQLARVAPRALITTPNKARSAEDSIAMPPRYSEHVREWTVGEFYWVLRSFYSNVRLFTLPDLPGQVEAFVRDGAYEPRVSPCGVLSSEWALIGLCESPRLEVS